MKWDGMSSGQRGIWIEACVGIGGDFLYVYDCKCVYRSRTGIKGRKRLGVRRFPSPKVRRQKETCMNATNDQNSVYEPRELKEKRKHEKDWKTDLFDCVG